MKISFKHQALERKNSEICAVTEYQLEDEHLDFAIIKISGRYPPTNYAMNQKCKEVVYVQEGSGKVIVNGKEYLINTGDLVLIEANEKFCWEGHMKLHISCTPAFTVEQHEWVD